MKNIFFAGVLSYNLPFPLTEKLLGAIYIGKEKGIAIHLSHLVSREEEKRSLFLVSFSVIFLNPLFSPSLFNLQK